MEGVEMEAEKEASVVVEEKRRRRRGLMYS